MKSEHQAVPSLREMEEQSVAEGQEWTRRRLTARLQSWVDKHGAFSPCRSATLATMQEACVEPQDDSRPG